MIAVWQKSLIVSLLLLLVSLMSIIRITIIPVSLLAVHLSVVMVSSLSLLSSMFLLLVAVLVSPCASAQGFVNRDNAIDRGAAVRQAEETAKAINARIEAENKLRDSEVRTSQEIKRLQAEIAKLQSQIKSEEIKERLRQERLNFQRAQLEQIRSGLNRSRDLQEQIIRLAELEYRLGLGRWDTYSLIQLKRQLAQIELQATLTEERGSFLDSVQ